MKCLLLILNLIALVLGTLATQSCEDTSYGYQHGYYNRSYYNGNAYNTENPYNNGYYNVNPYNNGYYNRRYYPSGRPSIDVHL
jgi:hypothetical protein